MSGYRTPYYNGVLHDVRYSMHQFGGAADIFVDRHDLVSRSWRYSGTIFISALEVQK
jgi:uncharacterized protein YcbK (DUF882 family)